MGKSVFPESDPAYIGVYEGAMGRESTRAAVEGSDCLILLGAMMTDINLGIYTAHIDRRYEIYAGKDRVAVGLHAYDDVRMEDFVAGLAAHSWVKRAPSKHEHPEHPGPYTATAAPMTVAALFRQLNAFLQDDMVVIADPGDALFGAEDLYIHDGAHFMGPAYYCSLGFAVPAALGVQMAPKLRPLVLVGDGAFQMSGMELASIARYRQNPIVILFDNDGYGTERPMLDGKFNDVHRWEYAKIPAVLGAGLGIKVTTEIEMEAALAAALANTGSFTIIQVMLERGDHSPPPSRPEKTHGRAGGESEAVRLASCPLNGPQRHHQLEIGQLARPVLLVGCRDGWIELQTRDQQEEPMTKQATKSKPAAPPGGVHVYLDWARERLDEVEATLTSLGKTAGKLQGEARAKADRALVDMRARGDSFRKAIAREGEGGEAAWGKAKALLETDWKAFEASVQEYVDAAGQQVEQQKAAFKARADAQIKAWRQAADKMNTGAAGFAAARRADVDAAVKRMTAEATAAQAKLDKVGSESWSVMRTALGETRAAFDRTNKAVHEAFKHPT